MLRQMLPEPAKKVLRSIRRRIKHTLMYQGTERYCPVCEKTSRIFAAFGDPPRGDAQCSYCTSLERHRLVWLYFTRNSDVFDGRFKKMLHVAPEPCLEDKLKARLGHDYLTADLSSPAMVQMDITNIQYPEETFDVIYCSHVLEHVPDDRKAMGELRRVLKHSGWAILLVPITSEKTFEDPSAVTAEDRLRVFGQHDHVRRYGSDYSDRLKEAGFKVEVIPPSGFITKDEIELMGLTADAGAIYLCTKDT